MENYCDGNKTSSISSTKKNKTYKENNNKIQTGKQGKQAMGIVQMTVAAMTAIVVVMLKIKMVCSVVLHRPSYIEQHN